MFKPLRQQKGVSFRATLGLKSYLEEARGSAGGSRILLIQSHGKGSRGSHCSLADFNNGPAAGALYVRVVFLVWHPASWL